MRPYCANIEITDRCNFSCIHCFNLRRQRGRDMSFFKFRVIFNKLLKGGVFYYNLIGGEPLLNKKWRKIVEYISKKKICYSISTNGSLIREKDIQYLKNKGINHVGVSLDGPKHIHNKIRKNNKAFDYLLRCTYLLKKYEIPFTFQMTLMKLNYPYISQTCKIAEKLGASLIRFNFYKDFNDPYKLLSLPNENLKNVIIEIEKSVKLPKRNLNFKVYFEDSLAVSLRNKTTCGAGTHKLQIDPEGNVTPCRYLQINMGNLYTSKLSTILSHSIMDKLKVFHKTVKRGCEHCYALKTCRGGCPAFIYNAYKNFSTKDPRCWEN
ncbi:MAG: hypothetical protein CO145_01745 [Candidatus Nealsonbacteria bacterium CG_4_9_14_3_um_filter_37_13]|uniref:Radical SAM core domain-containing protein n=2 Tax=Candidatus Nealsoniibacteriota TaxID=1817911 RepID=A0A2H0TIT6_9BACT|nr:MAG: hypothetical protein COU43_02575 [Candidatus Nealsonbacteria bacterium CG10_big_fil_rev_8_21_14_0_10_37_25]PJA84216.1 MAG: hypothetical protein CO145_01745 [Candidatus Nealsonbacteria bacterium CG_4_9_14_3_um_filter_37_13]